ncbi:MAG: hypothetical protein ABH877_02420, partial [bacterium]
MDRDGSGGWRKEGPGSGVRRPAIMVALVVCLATVATVGVAAACGTGPASVGAGYSHTSGPVPEGEEPPTPGTRDQNRPGSLATGPGSSSLTVN